MGSASRRTAGGRRNLVCALLLAIVRQCAEALIITVDDVECVHQYVEHDNDQVSGNFVVVDKDSDWYSDSEDVEMVVTGPTGATVMAAKARGGQKFAFKAQRRGHYKICFHNPTHGPEQISFSVHVGHIPDLTEVAKDEHFDPLEAKVAMLREALERVSLEQAYLRRRDARHKKTNESTQRRLLWYTLTEYLALLAVSVAQVYLIQRLFSRRIGYNKF